MDAKVEAVFCGLSVATITEVLGTAQQPATGVATGCAVGADVGLAVVTGVAITSDCVDEGALCASVASFLPQAVETKKATQEAVIKRFVFFMIFCPLNQSTFLIANEDHACKNNPIFPCENC